MIGRILAAITIVIFAGMVVWAFWETVENNAVARSHRVALPSMARVGEIEVNNSTLYLWAFDFEGKRCLWATSRKVYARGGLTCWEKK